MEQRIVPDIRILDCLHTKFSQAMGNQDFTERLDFGKFMMKQIRSEAIDPGRIIFTDEAHFYLDSYVNKQNYRIWGTEKPSIRTKQVHAQRVTVWGEICEKGLLGPIFIEAGKTVDREVYAGILQTAIEEARSNGMKKRFYWQQDAATPHRVSENLQVLHETSGRRVIAKRFPSKFNAGCSWLAHSPDISAMDFFLWGYTKDKCIRTMQESWKY